MFSVGLSIQYFLFLNSISH